MRAFKRRPAGHDYHWRLTLLRKGPDSREGRTGRRDAVPRLLVVGSAPHANSSLPWQQQVVLEERGSWFAPRAALVTPRMPVAVADPPQCPLPSPGESAPRTPRPAATAAHIGASVPVPFQCPDAWSTGLHTKSSADGTSRGRLLSGPCQSLMSISHAPSSWPKTRPKVSKNGTSKGPAPQI